MRCYLWFELCNLNDRKAASHSIQIYDYAEVRSYTLSHIFLKCASFLLLSIYDGFTLWDMKDRPDIQEKYLFNLMCYFTFLMSDMHLMMSI